MIYPSQNYKWVTHGPLIFFYYFESCIFILFSAAYQLGVLEVQSPPLHK